MLTRQVVRCRPGLWPRNGRQSRGHYRKRFGAHHRKLSRGTRLSPERRPVGSFPTPRTTPLPLHVDRLRDQLNYSQQIPPRQCASHVEHRNSGQKKRSRGGAAPVLGMAMRFCRMRAVRPCCAVHPSTEAFGRPAREAFSKSLPQEEPTVAWRLLPGFLCHDDPLVTHFARRLSSRPGIAFTMLRTVLLSILSCASTRRPTYESGVGSSLVVASFAPKRTLPLA